MANFFNNIDEILKKKVFWVRICHRKCLSNTIICYGLLERYFVLSIYMYIKLNNIKKRLTRIAFSVLPLVTVVTLQPLLPMTDRITTYNTRIICRHCECRKSLAFLYIISMPSQDIFLIFFSNPNLLLSFQSVLLYKQFHC